MSEMDRYIVTGMIDAIIQWTEHRSVPIHQYLELIRVNDAAQRQRIAQLEAALKQEQAAHEEDVAQLVKHCACEWEDEEPRRQTVTCGTHRQLEARVAELEALYADSCSALNAHMEIHAEVVNWVKELEAEVVRLTKELHVVKVERGL